MTKQQRGVISESLREQKRLLQENVKDDRRRICKAIYERLFDSSLSVEELQEMGQQVFSAVTDWENRV